MACGPIEVVGPRCGACASVRVWFPDPTAVEHVHEQRGVAHGAPRQQELAMVSISAMDTQATSIADSDTELAERVARLEREVAALKGDNGASRRYMRSFGVMPDDTVSREAVRLGAAYRKRQPKC